MNRQVVRLLIGLTICIWVALIQPGVSYFWLIDSDEHAKIDADLYAQTPDGRTLPGHPWHPPHDHPTSVSLGAFELMQQNAFDAEFYDKVFSPAVRLSLQPDRFEVAVIAQPIDLAPPDIPPRA
jgi:hypothetical protein